MKIKIFSDTFPAELEAHVNDWLEHNPEVEPAQITAQFDSEVASTEGGSLVWNGWSHVTVLYREKQ